jgi:hypothetical protein
MEESAMTEVIGLDGTRYQKEDWRRATLKERLRYLNHNMLVAYPQLVKIMTEVQRRITRCDLIQKGDCILIVADTGSGKSFLINYFEHGMPPKEHETWSERPLCRFNTPPRPSNGVMSECFLIGLGASEPESGTLRQKSDRCGLYARNCATRLTLIDNAHRIPEKRIVGIRECGDWCCDLFDAAPLLLVLLGAPPVEEVIMANEQLRRRGLASYRLDYFDVSTPARARAYLQFLGLFDLALPLSELCNLGQRDMLLRFLCATLGIIDLHVRLSTDAVQIAVESGKETFGLQELTRAYEQMVGDAQAIPNPFHLDFKPRLLTKPGEVFADWLKNARGRYAATKQKEGETA